MDTEQRNEMPESETKDYYSWQTVARVSSKIHWFPKPQTSRVMWRPGGMCIYNGVFSRRKQP